MHSSANSSSDSPSDKLDAELQAAGQLLDVLKREQACLIDADVGSLVALTEEKSKILGFMNELATRRHQALAAAGYEAGETGMAQWLGSPVASVAAQKSWQALVSMTREAKELNRTNGLLIGQHMARTQTALNILQGNQQGNAIYGPNGQATNATSTRSLVVG